MSLEDAALLGYFSVIIKPLEVSAEPFSNTMRKKLARFSDINEKSPKYNMAAYLMHSLVKILMRKPWEELPERKYWSLQSKD